MREARVAGPARIDDPALAPELLAVDQHQGGDRRAGPLPRDPQRLSAKAGQLHTIASPEH